VCAACGAPISRQNSAADMNSNEARFSPRERLNPVSATKRFSPAVFGFVLVCFLLPFVTVSCNQQKVASFTGIQLVFGTTVQQPQMFGPPKVQRVNGEPLAIVAFVSSAIALALSFAASRSGEVGASMLSGISLVALLLLKSRLEDQIRQRSSGFLQANYELGFWVVVFATVIAGVLYAIAPWRSKAH